MSRNPYDRYYYEEPLPGHPVLMDRETGKPVKLKGGYQSKRQPVFSNGVIEPAGVQAEKSGYDNLGSYPCPHPGSEDGVVYFEYRGRPAIWDSGILYVRRSR